MRDEYKVLVLSTKHFTIQISFWFCFRFRNMDFFAAKRCKFVYLWLKFTEW